MCDYMGYEFGAGSYPDSYCIDGQLHDADSDWLSDEDIPCPMCRPRAAMKWWAANNGYAGAPRKEALRGARSLVKDIRKNRGVRHLYGAAPPEVQR